MKKISKTFLLLTLIFLIFSIIINVQAYSEINKGDISKSQVIKKRDKSL